MREVSRAGPPGPGNGNGTPDQERAESKILKTERVSLSSGVSSTSNLRGLQATENLKQSKAENLVRKYLANSVRYDRWISPSLRTLDRAQSELQHDGLAIAISAAEWFATDLLIWRAYSPELARAECWRNIQIGLAWVQYLRRKGDRP
jgi:hypothetical protein